MNLLGKIIISTRPSSQEDIIRDYLKGKGATYMEFPMIEILPAEITAQIKEAISRISSFQWLMFTSKNGVEYFFRILDGFNIGLNKLADVNIAVIGAGTAKELTKHGVEPDFISAGNTSEEMVKELKAKQIKAEDKILLVLGELAKDTLEDGLKDIAKIARIDVYRTVETKNHSEDIIEKIKNDKYDMIIFTSPSGFCNFVKIKEQRFPEAEQLKIACIGKTTEAEIKKHNCMPLLVSPKSDGYSFAREIENYLIK
jgi:uroporphyrinogen-III synthase